MAAIIPNWNSSRDFMAGINELAVIVRQALNHE